MDEGKIRVGIIYGGRSAEHRVSVASAKALLECIDREKYEPVPIGIGMDGTWHLGAQPARLLEAGRGHQSRQVFVFSAMISTSS